MEKKYILIADDNEADFILVRKAMAEESAASSLEWVRSGEEVIGHLERETHPEIVLMDMHMPRMDGLETLKIIKSKPHLACTPVIMMSNSGHDKLAGEAYRCGASAFIKKPGGFQELKACLAIIKTHWLQYVTLLPRQGNGSRAG